MRHTDAGRTYFDAEVRTLDFGSPDAAKTINDWVSGKTNGRIPLLLDRISSDEVLFLVNAIYFKGTWRRTFDPKDTRTQPFHGADGREGIAFDPGLADLYRITDVRPERQRGWGVAHSVAPATVARPAGSRSDSG